MFSSRRNLSARLASIAGQSQFRSRQSADMDYSKARLTMARHKAITEFLDFVQVEGTDNSYLEYKLKSSKGSQVTFSFKVPVYTTQPTGDFTEEYFELRTQYTVNYSKWGPNGPKGFDPSSLNNFAKKLVSAACRGAGCKPISAKAIGTNNFDADGWTGHYFADVTIYATIEIPSLLEDF
jgi:hypothetical protein